VGGRQHGAARSSDGYLEVKLAEPGSRRAGTNPEQLLAAGWSACFESAIGIAALKRRIKLPSDPIIEAENEFRKNYDLSGCSLTDRTDQIVKPNRRKNDGK
jgi:osmotically inducible protein OsmC